MSSRPPTPRRASGSPSVIDTGLGGSSLAHAANYSKLLSSAPSGVLAHVYANPVASASRGAPSVLGRHAIADAGLYSVCLAIENLWLAATAEGMGVGWVSFYREEFLSELIGLPAGVRPIAWLCLGPVTHLEDVPDLERHGWRSRLPLSAVLHRDRW